MKHVLAVLLDVLRQPIPGEFAGASLKHCFVAGHQYSCQTTIPGEFAGASLKQPQLKATVVDVGAIPGEFAGASLKRRRRRLSGLVDTRPSPANSPGPH